MKSFRTSGKYKVLGILGGMGPEATADFYRAVVASTPADSDQQHIPTIILSNPEVPDRTESILQGHHRALPYLIEGVIFLEQAGVDFIVIPCNTAHCYIADMRQAVKIPILSIIEETVAAIRQALPLPGCIGLLATDGTHATDLYGRHLRQAGLRFICPDKSRQALVMEGIRHVKSGHVSTQSYRLLEEVEYTLKAAGAEALILGCTELPMLAAGAKLELPVFNPTLLLASAAVSFAFSKIPQAANSV
jgi:aspartate racemase